MPGEKTQKASAYGLTKKKIINLVNMLDNKAPADAAKLRKEFGMTPTTKKMMGGGANMMKKPVMAKKKKKK